MITYSCQIIFSSHYYFYFLFFLSFFIFFSFNVLLFFVFIVPHSFLCFFLSLICTFGFLSSFSLYFHLVIPSVHFLFLIIPSISLHFFLFFFFLFYFSHTFSVLCFPCRVFIRFFYLSLKLFLLVSH